MQGKVEQELLQKEINRLGFKIPSNVFQFDFEGATAGQYLIDHPNVPFIIHSTPLDNCFFLVMPDMESGGFRAELISSPEQDKG